MTLDSMREWLSSWGDGPNWSDPSGSTVPVTKESLRALIEHAEKMRAALYELRTQALDSSRIIGPAMAASIAITCEDALEP